MDSIVQDRQQQGDDPDEDDDGLPAARRAEAPGWSTIPAAAGIIYALAWISGLLIAPASLRVTASGDEVVRAYVGHQAPAIAEVVLTEGVAGLALAVVIVALSRAAGLRDVRQPGGHVRLSHRYSELGVMP